MFLRWSQQCILLLTECSIGHPNSVPQNVCFVGGRHAQQMAETQGYLFANFEVTVSKNVYIVGPEQSGFGNEF